MTESRKNTYYPVFLNLTQKSCLVVGGGKVALRKVKILTEYSVDIHINARKVRPELKELSKNEEHIKIIESEYKTEYLKNKFFVIAATDNSRLNRTIAEDADKEGILVNVVDRAECCDFISPAILRRNDLQIAVSTGGKCPALSKQIRNELREEYTQEYGDMLNIAGSIRDIIQNEITDYSIRKKIFHSLAALIRIKNSG